MARILSIILMLALTLVPAYAFAGDLAFPKTEKEIVDALSLKDAQVTFEGVTYESSAGKVYKIIDGKRYRMRGLAGIAESEIVPKAAALIHFDYDSAQIKPDSYPLLDEFGKALTSGLSSATVMIAGHTDAQGTAEYNQTLSENRARAVATYLKEKYAISPDRLEVKGYGKDKPVASNDTEDGRTKNRRVEFIRVE